MTHRIADLVRRLPAQVLSASTPVLARLSKQLRSCGRDEAAAPRQRPTMPSHAAEGVVELVRLLDRLSQPPPKIDLALSERDLPLPERDWPLLARDLPRPDSDQALLGSDQPLRESDVPPRKSDQPQPVAIVGAQVTPGNPLRARGGQPVKSSLGDALRAVILSEGRWSVDVTRRSQICTRRFGLDGPSETLEEIGERYGVTRERIRQIVEKSIKQLQGAPFAAAFRRCVERVLKERECVTVAELGTLSPWFASIDERGLKPLVEAFVPKSTFGSFVSIVPAAELEHVIATMYKRADALRHVNDPESAIDQLAINVACETGHRKLAKTLAALAKARFSTRRRSFTDFVHAYVAASAIPVRLADVIAAGERRGFTVSAGQARNAVSACNGVFALGGSKFGTFAQLFPAPAPELDTLARRAESMVRAKPHRQFHAGELLEDGLRHLPREAAFVPDDYALAALLRTRTALSYIGRMIFSAQAQAQRLELAPLARRVLEEAGQPLPLATLLQEMRKYRGVSRYSIQAVLDQLIEVKHGAWGLPGRDENAHAEPVALVKTPADTTAQAILIEDAFAALRPAESIAVVELRGRLERGSEEAQDLDAGRLRALLAMDERFHVSARGFVRLSDPRLDERAAS